MKQSKPYIIKGVEEVYDEFNDFLCRKPIDAVRIASSSLENAVKRGKCALQAKVDKYRREKGHMGQGNFIAYVTQVLDLEGTVLYESS
jgi:hypothetical protein